MIRFDFELRNFPTKISNLQNKTRNCYLAIFINQSDLDLTRCLLPKWKRSGYEIIKNTKIKLPKWNENIKLHELSEPSRGLSQVMKNVNCHVVFDDRKYVIKCLGKRLDVQNTIEGLGPGSGCHSPPLTFWVCCPPLRWCLCFPTLWPVSLRCSPTAGIVALVLLMSSLFLVMNALPVSPIYFFPQSAHSNL